MLWILWNCGSTVPTAYDYYEKEEKTDGRDEWLNHLSTKPGQAHFDSRFPSRSAGSKPPSARRGVRAEREYDGHDEQRSGRDVWVDDAKHDKRPGDP